MESGSDEADSEALDRIKAELENTMENTGGSSIGDAGQKALEDTGAGSAPSGTKVAPEV